LILLKYKKGMAKEIKYGEEARSAMFSGIEQVAKTVTVTMGPRGRNVVFDRGFGAPQVTNDGATIAKEIELEDKFENMWAELVKQAADRTNTLAGDGTTTATLLTYALAKEGLKNIKDGVNAVELKNGMKKAGELVVGELAKNAIWISSKQEVSQVATISAQDEKVWDIIAEAMEQVWNDGVISVEEGQTFEMEVDITEWMQFDQGYMSPYMVSNTDKMIAEIKDAPVLIVDKKISSMKDLLPLLEQLVNSGKKDLVIIAEDIDGEALTTIILNKLKGVLNVLGVKAPGFGEKKKEMLRDIAILTGATVIAEELGMKLENTTFDHLGLAKNIISTQDNTTVIGWSGDSDDIESRVSELKMQYQNSWSKYDKEKLSERIAKLAGWVAVIKVWAVSEVEMKEKKLRIEDALNATRAAVAEWVVAGGWIALLRASKVLEWIDLWSSDQNIWAAIVQESLSYPLKQIVENSGRDDELVVKEVLSKDDVNYGYDAALEEFTDMIEVWIIDPKKVERIALQEAISLAGMFLTTESAISDIPGKGWDAPAMPPMGGMGWMW
jgi:chaperonin GroEL